LKSIEADTLRVLGTIVDSINDKKGEEILAIDVRDISSLTQFFVICTGTNNRQNSTIAEEIVDRLKKIDVRPLHVEPGKTSGWMLLDYGFVIIHVFLPETRETYNIEGMWGDGKKLSADELLQYAA